MDMREKLARAICAKGGGNFCRTVDDCPCGRGQAPHWSRCAATEDQLYLSGNMEAADAVLEALMEPTEGMIEAALSPLYIKAGEEWAEAEAHLRQDWQAMITAARTPEAHVEPGEE
jgi:hypothetical protein